MQICKEEFMRMPLSKRFFDVIIEVKSNNLAPVLEQYCVSQEDLCLSLWEEFNIPGMEVRIANTALDFLIDCCETKRDLCHTLKGEIKKNILMAGIFYTNIAPEAISTAEVSVSATE